MSWDFRSDGGLDCIETSTQFFVAELVLSVRVEYSGILSPSSEPIVRAGQWFPKQCDTVASGADFQNIKVQNLSEPIRFSLLVDPNRDSWRLRILRRGGSVDTMTMSQEQPGQLYWVANETQDLHHSNFTSTSVVFSQDVTKVLFRMRPKNWNMQLVTWHVGNYWILLRLQDFSGVEDWKTMKKRNL
jgi:hypothetical protein